MNLCFLLHPGKSVDGLQVDYRKFRGIAESSAICGWDKASVGIKLNETVSNVSKAWIRRNAQVS